MKFIELTAISLFKEGLCSKIIINLDEISHIDPYVALADAPKGYENAESCVYLLGDRRQIVVLESLDEIRGKIRHLIG